MAHFLHRPHRIPPKLRGSGRSADEPPAPPIGPEPFHPSLDYVLKTRYILQYKVIHGKGLPLEIVDLIIDEAEYWPSVEVKMDKRAVIRQDADRSLVRTLPLCYDEKTLKSSAPGRPLPHRCTHPCRKIVFHISSHDQGWGGDHRGSYGKSWTWFDAVVIRAALEKIRALEGTNPEHDGDDIEERSFPTNYGEIHSLALQSNRTAIGETEPYTIVWHYLDDIQPDSEQAQEIQEGQGRGRFTLDGSTVRELQVGDAISIWGRTRFSGWSNYVDWLSVRVFWAV